MFPAVYIGGAIPFRAGFPAGSLHATYSMNAVYDAVYVLIASNTRSNLGIEHEKTCLSSDVNRKNEP